MPWTIDVVDFRTVSLPDRQDVRAPFPSRRLASRQTVRAVATLSVHLDLRHLDIAIARAHMALRRERQLAAAFIRANSIR